jgi:hypothetical protein
VVLHHQLAVFEPEHPVRLIGDRSIMGDEDDRGSRGAGEAAEELDDRQARLAVEVAGGLVGEDDRRPVGQCPGDSDPLLLAAAQPTRLALLFGPGQLDLLQTGWLPGSCRAPTPNLVPGCRGLVLTSQPARGCGTGLT